MPKEVNFNQILFMVIMNRDPRLPAGGPRHTAWFELVRDFLVFGSDVFLALDPVRSSRPGFRFIHDPDPLWLMVHKLWILDCGLGIVRYGHFG